MKLHREGKGIIFASVTLSLGISCAAYLFTHPLVFFSLTVILVVSLGFIVQFFRVPNRAIHAKNKELICPADGKVVVIEEVFEPEYVQQRCIQLSIFMSPLDVHANYIPISGTVLYTQYHKGKHLVAWHPKSSTDNERSTLVIETEDKKQVLVRQIAGAMARRICFYSKAGSKVEQGEELGFIKFGSRVDVFLPLEAKIHVTLGQKVKNREDILASL
jgi:phosphatidylserine decarboxylase